MQLTPFTPAARKARVEIIPLIDVIFFLLATFVLFTLSLDVIRNMTVVLPRGGIEKGIDDAIRLQASESGAYYWSEGGQAAELITASEIRPRLEAYRRRVADPRVLIRGDNKAKFGAAIFALDEVRRTGIAQVSVETLASTTGN